MIFHTAAERWPTSTKASVVQRHFPRLFTGRSMSAPTDRATSLKKVPQDYRSNESFLNIVPQLQPQLESTHVGKGTRNNSGKSQIFSAWLWHQNLCPLSHPENRPWSWRNCTCPLKVYCQHLCSQANGFGTWLQLVTTISRTETWVWAHCNKITSSDVLLLWKKLCASHVTLFSQSLFSNCIS